MRGGEWKVVVEGVGWNWVDEKEQFAGGECGWKIEGGG